MLKRTTILPQKLPVGGAGIAVDSCKQQYMSKKATRPIREKKEVRQSNDERIDQDFPGFPHAPAGRETITHNGSANAFKGTEYSGEEEEIKKDDTPGKSKY